MVDFWIDIESASGERLGPGPITTATGWEHTQRLDAAGEFSFSIPASDPVAALLVQRRIVRCRGLVNNVVTEYGGGVIDQIVTSVGDPTTLTVSGRDLLGELGDSSVENLKVREQRWTFLNDPFKGVLHQIVVHMKRPEQPPTDPPFWHWSWPCPLAHDGNLATHEVLSLRSHHSVYQQDAAWLYVGYDSRFSAIRFTFHEVSLGSAQPTVAPQYYSSGINGWKALTVVDGTNPGNGTWKQNGAMTFDIPSDWVRYNEAVGGAGNWFWVRMRNSGYAPADPLTVTASVAEVEVFAEFPTTNGVNLIMAYAPTTWKRTGYPATAAPKYLGFQGQSVLEALYMLTEQGGQVGGAPVREHFRLAESGRAIEWLGTTVTPSGVRAVDVFTSDAVTPEVALITELSESADTTETVTRLFPFSGDGIGLHGTTRTAPSGYVRGTSPDGNAFLEHTAGIAAFGTIERWAEFAEISAQQSQTISTHAAYTANAVFDKALEYLRQHSVTARQYSLSVARFAALLRPGDTIHVVYHEYVDGVRTVRIDSVADARPLHILGATLRVDAAGVGTIGLDVSTIDRKAMTDADVVVNMARERRSAGANITNIVQGALGAAPPPQPPIAGADIWVSAFQVSRAGNHVLRFSGAGHLLAEYATLAAALGAAAIGDVVEWSAGIRAENVTVPAGVTLRGADREGCVLTGVATVLGVLASCTVQRLGAEAGPIVGVVSGAEGSHGLLDGVTVRVSNTAGPAYAVHMTAGGDLTVRDGELLAEVGSPGYAAFVQHGTLTHLVGRAVGTVPLSPYWEA